MKILTHESVLAFTFRIILGILFFFQGYDKVFRVKMKTVLETFRFELGDKKIPELVLVPSAFFTSYVELICGLLLIFGLFTKYALYVLGLDMIMVVVAFSIMKPVWDMTLVFPRLVLWGMVMFIPDVFNKISLDYLLFR